MPSVSDLAPASLRHWHSARRWARPVPTSPPPAPAQPAWHDLPAGTGTAWSASGLTLLPLRSPIRALLFSYHLAHSHPALSSPARLSLRVSDLAQHSPNPGVTSDPCRRQPEGTARAASWAPKTEARDLPRTTRVPQRLKLLVCRPLQLQEPMDPAQRFAPAPQSPSLSPHTGVRGAKVKGRDRWSCEQGTPGETGKVGPGSERRSTRKLKGA